MFRYFFLSIALLIFTLDRLKYLYKIHMNQHIPIWIRTMFITLCSIFNITLIITFSISLYSQSSFYWKIQLIHVKFDVVISCFIGIIAICHIYYNFNHKIQSYLNEILSQHQQLKQIESINNKLFDKNYMLQLTQGKIPSNGNNHNIDNIQLRKEDILANNLNLAAKIREANYKLFSYILLLTICLIIDLIYIPISIKQIKSMGLKKEYLSSYLTTPYQLTSNLEFILQRILFDIITIILIYWMYDNKSLFKTLCNRNKNKYKKKHLCIISFINCSLFMIAFREIYLIFIYGMNTICPCCISRACLNLQQKIYDIKEYKSYFGHLPKNNKYQDKHKRIQINSNINNNLQNNVQMSDIEESLPTHTRNRSQSHGIFESPPIILTEENNKTKNGRKIKDNRRPSHASICGIEIKQDNDGHDGDNKNKIHHRKQSTLLQYDDDNENRMDGINLSDTESGHSGYDEYDLHVPQQIIDKDAEEDDIDFDDTKSEQYDNFAEIMIEREKEYFSNKSRENLLKVIDDKNRRSSVEMGKEARGSIGNLGKKRRGSLILNAVDNIKQGIKNMKEKQQQKKESKKEALFIESRKSMIVDFDTDKDDNYHNTSTSGNDTDLTNGTEHETTGDDEKEYYRSYSNSQPQHQFRHKHKRQNKDRLSAIRNSLKSIIPSKNKKNKKKGSNKYNAVSMRENSETSNNRLTYEPFEYCTDTMIIHQRNNSDPLAVRAELTTDTEDDNISIATYGTTKDCLDDDLESELNALNAANVIDTSFISNVDNINHTATSSDDDCVASTDNERDKEKSVSLSLESISNSGEEDEKSPPAPVIIKKKNTNVISKDSHHGVIRRSRKNSIPLAQIREIDNATSDDFVSTDNNEMTEDDDDDDDDTTSVDDMDVTVTIDDIGCDDMMTASML